MSTYRIEELKIDELEQLTQLFQYNNIEEMIAANAKAIKRNRISIFGLFKQERLIGELHVKYISEDTLEAIKGQRAYLYAFRIHPSEQGKGLGKYLLRGVINKLLSMGYVEFTVGVEEENERAKHLYQTFGFTQVLAHKQESYQGDSYCYDLLIRSQKRLRDFIFVIGPSGVGKSTLCKNLYQHYKSVTLELNQAPEFSSFDGFEEVAGILEEEACWQWTLSSLFCYHKLGFKNIICCDFDDLRTKEIPKVFHRYDYITIKLVCSNYEQNYRQMQNRGEGLINFDLLEKSSQIINSRPLLVNEFAIDIAEKTPDEVCKEAIELVENATTTREYHYEEPNEEWFYSWVRAYKTT